MVFRTGPQDDGPLRTQFVGVAAEEILGISSDPEHFRERLLAWGPEPHREPLTDSLDEAAREVCDRRHGTTATGRVAVGAAMD
ncbi:MAG: hypothetical protein BRD31_06810 [Bacteroidetes bacterium QH_2_64_26]|nr:MAG: hypothetical protein BRD31_06810 [Bacteroidetes bacterium QH_2_64_26]